MKRQRVQDPSVRKQQILKAAQAVLTDKPYSRLVMEDIAREAGISKGLLYLYFKDKESLFDEVARDLLGQVTHKLRGISADLPPKERIEEMVSILLAFGEDHKEFTSQFVPEQIISSGRGSRILEEYESFLKIVGRFYQDAVDSGSLRPHETRTSAMIMMEIAMLYVRRKFIYRELSGSLKTYAKDVVHILFAGFGAK